MRFITRAAAIAGAALFIALPGGGLTLAQESTPIAGMTPVATDAFAPLSPADCAATPLTVAAIREIAGKNASDPSHHIPEEAIDLPAGKPVDAKTRQELEALSKQFIACITTNDTTKLLALFTDDLIERYAYDFVQGLPADESATPEPIDENALSGITETHEYVALDGGKAATVIGVGAVNPMDPSGKELWTLFHVQLIFAKQDGGWKIDDLRILAEDLIPNQDCGGSEADGCATPETGAMVSGDGYSGYIISEEQAAGVIDAFTADAEQTFAPTEIEIEVLEEALPGYLATARQATPRMRDELASYERQYLGYITSHGEQRIVVNAYCDTGTIDPASEVVVVMDGGDCYWQATYDPLKREFISLSVNGEA